ncbi:MAG TPA: hypothetical protein VLG50_03090 [Candidatus Saccharimonadales bacterium]|nr:hypothetical protein [Candidatus Saccharimonadales bacterium]
MKKLLIIMITISIIPYTAYASTTARTTPSFIWRGQRIQYIPPEQYSAWYRHFQDYDKFLPRYRQFSAKILQHQQLLSEYAKNLLKLYSLIDTNPFYDRIVKPYKGTFYTKEYIHPLFKNADGSLHYPFQKIPIKRKCIEIPIEQFASGIENYENVSKKIPDSIADFNEKLPILQKIFDFHHKFQGWKKIQPQETLKKIDPIIQEYDQLFQKFKQKPLDPELIRLVHEKQQHLADTIEQAIREREEQETKTPTTPSPEEI